MLQEREISPCALGSLKAYAEVGIPGGHWLDTYNQHTSVAGGAASFLTYTDRAGHRSAQ